MGVRSDGPRGTSKIRKITFVSRFYGSSSRQDGGLMKSLPSFFVLSNVPSSNVPLFKDIDGCINALLLV